MVLKSLLLKSVRVFFLTIISILLISFGYFYSQRKLIENLIVQTIVSKSENSVSIKNLNITLHGLQLDSISYKHNGIDAVITKLDVVPNYSNIVSKFLFQIESNNSFVDSLSLENSFVTINLDSLANSSKENTITEEKTSFDDSFMKFVRTVSVSNLNVSIIKDNTTLFLLDSIYTSYAYDEDAAYKYRALSTMFLDKNLNRSSVEIISNKLDDEVTINLILNNFSLKEKKKMLVDNNINLYSGVVDGKLRLTLKKLNDYSLDGKFFVSNVHVGYKQFLIDDLKTEIVFQDKKVFVDNLTVKAKKSIIKGRGSYDLSNGLYNFKFYENGKINRDMYALSIADIKEIEKIHGDYRYAVTLRNSGVDASILLKDIEYDNILKLKEISLEAKTDFKKVNGSLKISDDKLSGNVKAQFDLESKDVALKGDLNVDGYNFVVGGKKISLFSQIKKIDIRGANIDLLAKVDSVIIDSSAIVSQPIVLALNKKSHKIRAIVNDSSSIDVTMLDNSYAVKAYINNKLWHESIHLPTAGLDEIYADLSLKANITTNNGVIGFKGKTVLNAEKSSSNISAKLGFDVDGTIGKEKNITIVGWKSNHFKILNQTFKPAINVELRDTTIIVNKLSIGNDRFALSGVFSQNQLSGIVSIYNYDLDLMKIVEAPVDARLNGNIFIRGSLQNPEIITNINVSSIEIAGNGLYSAGLNFKYSNGVLENIGDILFENRGYALGRISELRVSDKISIKAEGTKIQLYQLNKEMEKLEVAGNISYRCEFEGKDIIDLKGQLILDGDDIVYNGHNMKSFYSNVFVDNRRVYLKELSAVTDELFVSGSGMYPLNKDESDSMEFSVNIKGGILREANKDIQIFPKIVGEHSVANFKVTSYNKEIKLGGKVDFAFDTLFIPTVVDYVEDARVSVTLNQKEMSKVVGSGHIGKDSVFVANYAFNAKKDYHLYVKPLDIDFGVIGLKTTEQGIPFNFSVYQKPNDRGRVIPKGYGKFPVFSFTGPLNKPGLRGQLNLKDTEFSFPDFSDGKGKLPTFLQLELQIVATENVFYYLALRDYLKDQEVVRAKLNNGGFILVKGPLIPEKIKITGNLSVSNNGKLFYGNEFKIEAAKVEFVPFIERSGKINNTPMISLKAYTMIRDANGFPKKINLVLKIKEDGADYYTLSGRPGELKLDIDDASLLNIADAKQMHSDVFGLLFGIDKASEDVAYSDQVTRKGIEYGESYVFNTYLSNFLMKNIKIPYIDVIRVDSKIFSKYYDIMDNSDARADWDLLKGSSFEVGSFINDRIYLNYKGTIENDVNENKVWITHAAGLEYSLNNMVQLQLGVEFDPSKSSNRSAAYYGVMFNMPFDM